MNTSQYLQLQGNVKVALRWTAGDPTSEQVTRRFDEQENAGRDGLTGDRIWGYMESIRGTAPYWSRSAKDCFAMHDALGPATLFVTLSADDLGWDDLAIVLMNIVRARAGLPPLDR